MKIKKVCCIGAGFVGGPTMAVIALKCPHLKITVVDVNVKKINAWNGELSKLPVYEPGLAEIIEEVRNVNLFFSTEVDKAIEESEMIFMAVNTPTKTSGPGKGYAADLQYVEKCSEQIAKSSKSNKIIVEKSTLPVRTAEKIKEILESNKKSDIELEVISNPEFLAEGTAINDLFKSDRVLIGGEKTLKGNEAVNHLVEIYNNWIPVDKIYTTNVWSSELSKLVSNAMLAQRVSSINSISALCEKTGADINEVSKAVGLDSRIGPNFLNSSIGFGGSCFKKDILNLVYIARHYDLNEVADYWEGVVNMNNYQTERFAKKIIDSFNSGINNKLIAILGWSFKKNTNDSRESPSIYLAKKLLYGGAIINVYDPMVNKSRIISDIKNLLIDDGNSTKQIDDFLKRLNICDTLYKSVDKSNAISICTEWDEFKDIDWQKVKKLMNKYLLVFDGRNIVDKERIDELGFTSYVIGQS